MNQQAYIDGYLSKEAFKDALTGEDRSWGAELLANTVFLPTWGVARNARRGYKYYKDIQDRKKKWEERPETFTGPHDKKFTGPLAQRFLKGTEYEFMVNPYEHQTEKPPLTHRYAPKHMYDAGVAKKKADIEAEAKAVAEGTGTFSEETKRLYQTDPRVRAMFQQRGWNKIKTKAKEAAPWIIGGGAALVGIPMLLSMLFRKQRQGASPQQLAAIKAQIQALQMQRGQLSQKPMRLGLVDRGRR